MPGSNLANLGRERITRKLPDLESELLQSLGVAVIATDLDGYIIYWNRAAEHLYGWTADEVEGRSILDVTPSPDSRALAVAIFDRLTKGESWSGQFETRHKDGRRLLVDVTDSPIRDQHGKLTAIVGISKLVHETETGPSGLASKSEIIPRMVRVARDAIGRMSGDRPPLLRGFAIAGLLYGLALGARLLLDLIIPSHLPFISFFPVLIISAVFCGLWPTFGLLLAASVTGSIWLDSPLSFRLLTGAIFLVAGGIVIAPVIYAQSIHRRLEKKEEQLSLVTRELKHRLKNLFAVTSSISLQTLKSDLPREALGEAIASRIQAVARAQDLLSVTGDQGSDLRALIEAVVGPLSPDASRLEIIGPSISLPVEATTSFALVLHELATNALKHGAWASPQGRAVIKWGVTDERKLEFRWREEGGFVSSSPARKGFGSVVIARALSQARVHHEIRPQGADCLIELPI